MRFLRVPYTCFSLSANFLFLEYCLSNWYRKAAYMYSIILCTPLDAVTFNDIHLINSHYKTFYVGPSVKLQQTTVLIGLETILKRERKKSITGRVENCFLTMLADNRTIVRRVIFRGFNCLLSTSEEYIYGTARHMISAGNSRPVYNLGCY